MVDILIYMSKVCFLVKLFKTSVKFKSKVKFIRKFQPAVARFLYANFQTHMNFCDEINNHAKFKTLYSNIK